MRQGLGRIPVTLILNRLWEIIQSMPDSPQRRVYVNIGGVFSLAYERAFRVGELAKGSEFDPKHHLTREDMQSMFDPSTSASGHEIAVMRAPRRKTSAAKQRWRRQ